MQQSVKRRRRWGDRSDGRRLRSLDPLFGVIPFIMKKKSGSSNLAHGTLDVTEAEKYIRQKRESMPGIGLLHFFIAAYVRVISQKPAINRFISGQRIFARNDIQICLAVKKGMTATAQESTVKAFFDPSDTIEEVYHKIQAVIEEGKLVGDTNSTDATARILNYIPRLLLKFVVWLLEVLDYFGIMPKFLLKLSPFHASMFISDLGSIGLPPVYHHLYDFGNIPVFWCFGTKRRQKITAIDGSSSDRKLIDYTLVIDERICDGFYFSGIMRTALEIFKKPSQLDTPPEKVIEDID